MIKILRQYYSYEVKDSTRLEATLDITMWIMSQPYVLLPVPDYKADLKIYDSNGRSLIILSDYEFEANTGIKLDTVKDILLKKAKEANEKVIEFTESYRMIAVLLNSSKTTENSQDNGYYEKLKIKWIQKTSFEKSVGLTKKPRFTVDLIRYGLKQNQHSSVYFSVKLNKKLRFVKEFVYDEIIPNNAERIQIMKQDNHQIIKFGETSMPLFYKILIKFSIPPSILYWTRLGVGIGAIIPIITAAFLIFNIQFDRSIELLAGTIGLMFAFRWFVFQDMPIMEKWNNLILYLIISNIAVLISVIVAANIPLL